MTAGKISDVALQDYIGPACTRLIVVIIFTLTCWADVGAGIRPGAAYKTMERPSLSLELNFSFFGFAQANRALTPETRIEQIFDPQRNPSAAKVGRRNATGLDGLRPIPTEAVHTSPGLVIKLSIEDRNRLKTVATAMLSERLIGKSFEVIAHTSPGPSYANAIALTNRAATTIVRFLVDQGVSPKRLSAIGKGAMELKDRDNPRSPANRRIEIRVRQP